MHVPIVMAANSAYLPYAAVSICSMAETKDSNTTYCIHILTSEEILAGAGQVRMLERPGISIRFCNISEYVEPFMNQLYSRAHFSKEMYFRWWIGEVFPEYNSVIYLDCDTVVCCDLSGLYCTDLGESAVGGVVDFATPAVVKRISRQFNLSAERYINSGVLLINSAMWRSESLVKLCLTCLSEYDILTCPDQDILNLVCDGRIKYLDSRWNVQWQHFWDRPDDQLEPPFRDMFFSALHDPGILHFSSRTKPWTHPSAPCANYFWQYARQLPFFQDT